MIAVFNLGIKLNIEAVYIIQFFNKHYNYLQIQIEFDKMLMLTYYINKKTIFFLGFLRRKIMLKERKCTVCKQKVNGSKKRQAKPPEKFYIMRNHALREVHKACFDFVISLNSWWPPETTNKSLY